MESNKFVLPCVSWWESADAQYVAISSPGGTSCPVRVKPTQTLAFMPVLRQQWAAEILLANHLLLISLFVLVAEHWTLSRSEMGNEK